MKLAHLTATPDGGSRFLDFELSVDFAAANPTGKIIKRSDMLPIIGSLIMEMPAELVMDWHAIPWASFIVVLSGTVESETTDGATHHGAPARCFSPTIAAAVVIVPVPSTGRCASCSSIRGTTSNLAAEDGQSMIEDEAMTLRLSAISASLVRGIYAPALSSAAH